MSLRTIQELARRDRLYPSVILHGGRAEDRQSAAVELGRILLCQASPGSRPCGDCRHCRRIVWPETGEDTFHPDFRVLERDLRTATSVEATRSFLEHAQVSPFEARGQVFVVANAETLGGGAANALLKTLEEPSDRAPRNFLLLSPSQFDLLPTVRSRSLSVFLGITQGVDQSLVLELAQRFADCLEQFAATNDPVFLLAAAEQLAEAGSWSDPRATEPWTLAAAAVRSSVSNLSSTVDKRRVLALAEQLLEGWRMRIRGIRAQRILEGLVVRHFASVSS